MNDYLHHRLTVAIEGTELVLFNPRSVARGQANVLLSHRKSAEGQNRDHGEETTHWENGFCCDLFWFFRRKTRIPLRSSEAHLPWRDIIFSPTMANKCTHPRDFSPNLVVHVLSRVLYFQACLPLLRFFSSLRRWRSCVFTYTMK
jgi:hypothetical protein